MSLLHIGYGIGLVSLGGAFVYKLPDIVHQLRLWLPLDAVSDFLDRRAARRHIYKSPEDQHSPN